MRISVRAVPKASHNEVIRLGENDYRVRIAAVPEKGKANEKLIEILAEHFDVPKSLVVIVGGKSARIKLVDIYSDDCPR